MKGTKILTISLFSATSAAISRRISRQADIHEKNERMLDITLPTNVDDKVIYTLLLLKKESTKF